MQILVSMFPVPRFAGDGASKTEATAVLVEPAKDRSIRSVEVQGATVLVVGMAGAGGQISGAVEVALVQGRLFLVGAKAADNADIDSVASSRVSHPFKGLGSAQLYRFTVDIRDLNSPDVTAIFVSIRVGCPVGVGMIVCSVRTAGGCGVTVAVGLSGAVRSIQRTHSLGSNNTIDLDTSFGLEFADSGLGQRSKLSVGGQRWIGTCTIQHLLQGFDLRATGTSAQQTLALTHIVEVGVRGSGGLGSLFDRPPQRSPSGSSIRFHTGSLASSQVRVSWLWCGSLRGNSMGVVGVVGVVDGCGRVLIDFGHTCNPLGLDTTIRLGIIGISDEKLLDFLHTGNTIASALFGKIGRAHV